MRKLILCILDGWGHGVASPYNAINSAKTPNYDCLIKNHPHCLLEASGRAVGLPEGQMGNSEVGHITIGAGRVLLQDLPRINDIIATDKLVATPAIKGLVDKLYGTRKACHIIGLVSDGGVHSHINHIMALAEVFTNKGISVKLHAITDGRDVSPQSALKYLEVVAEQGLEIVSISGRYYAMDRDSRWDRVYKTYDAIANGNAPHFRNYAEVIQASYAHGIHDEFIIPQVMEGYSGILDGDGLIMANFRADRARQLSMAMASPEFTHFGHKTIKPCGILMMTNYSDALTHFMLPIFPAIIPEGTIGEVISQNNLKQLRVAETEKYAHVTYFLNGGRETPFSGEDRILMPSPKVATYDLVPEMSAHGVTAAVVNAVREDRHDFICVNYANADMVGHSGNIAATIKAIEAVDMELGKLMAVAQEFGYGLVVTADHGNAEEMVDIKLGQPLTSHTLNPVPFIWYGSQDIRLGSGGLADIAPTILKLMGVKKPPQMSGGHLY